MEQEKDAAAGDAGPPWDDPAAQPGQPLGRPNEVADEVVDAAPPRLDVVILTALQKVEADIDAYLGEVKAVAFDVSTTAGDRLARKHRLYLVQLRSAADTAYERGNAPFLDAQKAARAFRDRIKAKVEAVENVIDAQIKAAEAEATRRREAREEAERRRQADLRERIAQISAIARRAIGKPSAEIDAKIVLLVAVPIGDDFAEFKPEAERVHADSLAQLREMLTAAQAHEAEAARLAVARAELDRQRAEHEAAALAERQRQETAAAAERQREADARAKIARRQAEADARMAAEIARAAAEDNLIASIRYQSTTFEGPGVSYIQKAIDRFESGATTWEVGASDRVTFAIAEGRKHLDNAKSYAIAREAIEAQQAAEAQRLAAAQAEQERVARVTREAEEARALEVRQAAERQASEARAAEEQRQAQERAIPAAPAASAQADEPATLNLGAICARLDADGGLKVNAAFLVDRLHIAPAKTEGRASLYTESQFQAICAQMLAHISAVAELHAGVPA